MNKPVHNSDKSTGCLHDEDASLNKQKSHSQSQIAYKEDALEAVKIDPAVLEAHITITEINKNNVKPSNHTKEDIVKNDEVVENDEEDLDENLSTSFDRVVSMQKAALLSLAPEQLKFLLTYADCLRKKRHAGNKSLDCAFCKKNGESVSWYTGHGLKDSRGRVLCPVLRGLRCPRCGATGDRAHTIKYCPENIYLK